MATMIAIALIPLATYALFRSAMKGFLAAAPLGVLVLWFTMVSNESAAPDSDLDVVFAIMLFIWAAILIVVYALLFSLAGFMIFLVSHWRRHQGSRRIGWVLALTLVGVIGGAIGHETQYTPRVPGKVDILEGGAHRARHRVIWILGGAVAGAFAGAAIDLSAQLLALRRRNRLLSN